MATCGYLCPACEGRGLDEKGDACHWCTADIQQSKSGDEAIPKEEESEEWISQVHGRCCGDL